MQHAISICKQSSHGIYDWVMGSILTVICMLNGTVVSYKCSDTMLVCNINSTVPQRCKVYVIAMLHQSNIHIMSTMSVTVMFTA